MTKPLWTRLLARIDDPDPEGCWLWTGYCNPQTGYGQISLTASEQAELKLPRTATAPRVICTLAHGQPGDGEHVLHSCDVRACCAPHHVSWGTAAQNSRDAWERGGQKRGEEHHRAVYSDAQIAELRRRVAAGETAWFVAGELGIDQHYAYRLVKGHFR